MILSLVALVLALGTPAAATPAPPATPSSSAGAANPTAPVIRARFPPRQPDALPSAGPNDAVIRNSGSTNTAGYTIVVHPDATAVLDLDGTTAAKPIDKPMADAFFATLRAAGPVDKVATGHCMRSASFGSVTTVTFGGKTSGDLGCGTDPTLKSLHAAVARIADQVGATASGVRFRHAL
jgi:hypothetical protein